MGTHNQKKQDNRVRQRNKARFLTAFVIAAALFLSGCGSRSSREVTYQDNAYYIAETAAAAEAYYEDAYDYASGAQEKLSLNGSSSFTNDGGTSDTDAVQVPDDAPAEKKLIRTVDVSLETSTFDETVQKINAAIEQYGGYVESSGIYYGSEGQQEGRSANMTARIPAAKTDAFLSGAFGQARIISRNEQTEDISLKYTDLETKLSSLKTEETRLLELMAKADDVESLIALEERLSEIRYETESITSRLKTYDNQVVYSTVYLYINEVRILQAVEEDGFFTRIATGFRESATSLFEAMEDLLVWFFSNILSILLFVVIIAAVAAAIRKIVSKRRTAKAEKSVKAARQAKAENEEKKCEAADEISDDAKGRAEV